MSFASRLVSVLIVEAGCSGYDDILTGGFG